MANRATWTRNIAAAVLISAATDITGAAASDRMSVSTDLQIAMQRYIDRSLIDGAIVDIDFDTGETRRYFPTKAHPMVMKADGFFVLCANLGTEDGEIFEVDYYIIETDLGHRVFRVEVDNRQVLHDLMAAGFLTEF